MPFMPVQIFIQAAKSEEDFLYQSKMTKNESKNFLSFTKDAKETKLHVYKNARETMGLAHGMGILQPHPRCSRNARLNGMELKSI